MRNLHYLISLIDSPHKEKCFNLLEKNLARFKRAWGSSSNHQAWEGGYIDHVTEVMNIATHIYDGMTKMRLLPFKLSDALLVLFLHDLEKPWKEEVHFQAKFERKKFRLAKIAEFDIQLTPEQLNAINYVEGENEDYSAGKRVMNELAAFCHMCDVASARIWHNQPKEVYGAGY